MLAWKFVEMVYEQGLGKCIIHASDIPKWYERTRNCGEFPLFMRAWKFVDTVYEQELGKCITKSAINWGLKEAFWSKKTTETRKRKICIAAFLTGSSNIIAMTWGKITKSTHN